MFVDPPEIFVHRLQVCVSLHFAHNLKLHSVTLSLTLLSFCFRFVNSCHLLEPHLFIHLLLSSSLIVLFSFSKAEILSVTAISLQGEIATVGHCCFLKKLLCFLLLRKSISYSHIFGLITIFFINNKYFRHLIGQV